MKDLRTFVNEAIANTSNNASSNDFTSYGITDGVYDNEKVMVFGKPFTNDHDEPYFIAKELIKDQGYTLTSDIKDAYLKLGDKSEDVEEWCIIGHINKNEAEVVPFDMVEIKL